MAKLEAEQTSERVKSYNQVAAANGWMHSGGRRQFGYERDGSVNEAEAEVVREVAGRLVNGESLRQVATDLNERGVQTSAGKRWYGTTVRQMVISPRLAGLRTHNGEELPGDWQPILSLEQRAELVDALDRSARR